jgi:ABC-type multidrug transport system ATPase subunit
LKNSQIILLDEATSSVDTDTEYRIQQSLRKLCAGRTTFIVAHRLSTVMNADRIIVLDDGAILESGDHDTLIRARGKYADLWSKQVSPRLKKASESSTPETLINDLEPDIAELELAKISSAASANGSAGEGRATDDNAEDEPADADDKPGGSN